MHTKNYKALLEIIDKAGLPEQPQYFSIEFVKCDMGRDTGGEIDFIPMAMLHSNLKRRELTKEDAAGFKLYPWRDTETDIVKLVILEKNAQGKIVPVTEIKKGSSKPVTVVRPVHTRLIISINSAEVIW